MVIVSKNVQIFIGNNERHYRFMMKVLFVTPDERVNARLREN